MFSDSDIGRSLETIAYSLHRRRSPTLGGRGRTRGRVSTQRCRRDGYLNTHYTAVEPDKRWTNLRDRHELYCAGHLIEAGVAHYQATGQRTFLEAAGRYADYIGTVFGAGRQKRGYCGHEEIELALVKLYRATGEQRHLTSASIFVDERGRQPHYFDLEAQARGEDPARFGPEDLRLHAGAPAGARAGAGRWAMPCAPCISTRPWPTWRPRPATTA